MRLTKPIAAIVALTFFILVSNCGETFAQDSNAYLSRVPSGQKLKIQGIVIKRRADSFRVRDTKKIETDVRLTDSTKVRTHHNGVFRGGTTYDPANILRGLRLQVEGVGNADGQLVAGLVKFDERDLRTAQALQATVDPVEELAESNQERITSTEKNAEKMAGQIDENTALASAAQTSATRARITADSALKAATLANDRISGLGFYNTIKIITVYFESGRSTLLPEAKQVIDREATWTEIQNSPGYVVEVVGFADSTGTTEFNKELSENRTKAVIDYLVVKHSLPLQRLIRPFGYGADKPVADNDTSEGRAKNRRVEIRVLVNRGITGSTN
jgi:outer membrane protein OmpA-like peptidoglycan-associated protein